MNLKKLILLLMILSVRQICFGQKRFDLTFIASPQVSWMTSDSKFIVRGKAFTGFGYGVEGDIFLHSDSYIIVTGMTVSTVGGSMVYKKSIPFHGKVLPVGTSLDYSLTDLEIPLALKMRTRNFNRMRYFAQFGLTNWFNIKTNGTPLYKVAETLWYTLILRVEFNAMGKSHSLIKVLPSVPFTNFKT